MVKKITRKFIQGMGSVINLHPVKSYPVKSYVLGQSDADRIKGDWAKVGNSISKALASHSNVKA